MTVCGVGLIGGSLAAIARRQKLVRKVVGFGRTQANLDFALKHKLVDKITRDPAEAARGADLLVLAVPITTMPALLRQMVPHLAADAVITDVGSVKGWVVRELEPLLGPKMALVAAHPVAGKETTGAAAADPGLFKGRRVIITPSARTTARALALVEQLWDATGARVEQMDPESHDRILAVASHLPQLVSTSLAAAIVDQRVGGRLAAEYGAGGLRDMTRLASSSPEMWRDICLTNRDAILGALHEYGGVLDEFAALVEAGDPSPLEEGLRRGARIRSRIAVKQGPVVAIDGPVGAGKSTVAREVARVMRFAHINTGAMYRAVAIAAREAGVSPDDPNCEARLGPLLAALDIAFNGDRLLLGGRDVTDMLTTPEIGDLASRFSVLGAVRARMRELQRKAGERGCVVMEGRDIGTAVFPDADFKFYLDAAVATRARRRFAELRAKGFAPTLEQVLAELKDRDRRDKGRALAPLICADDAIVIDSTRLTIPQVVERIKKKIERKARGPNRA